jgi:hypothetical protein
MVVGRHRKNAPLVVEDYMVVPTLGVHGKPISLAVLCRIPLAGCTPHPSQLEDIDDLPILDAFGDALDIDRPAKGSPVPVWEPE